MMTENANSLLDLRTVPPELTRPEASNIHTRTMIIKGGTIHKLVRAIATALSHCLPDCELVTVPWAGHFSHLEKPEEFNSPARRFLSSVT